MTIFSVRLALCLILSGISVLISASLTHASPPLSEEVTERGLPSLQALDAVVERPLFSPARRKPVSPAVASPSGDPIVLSGIVISKGKRYAMIRDETGGASRRVTEGEVIGGRIIRRILSDRIVLVAAGSEESVIRLFNKEGASAEKPSWRAVR